MITSRMLLIDFWLPFTAELSEGTYVMESVLWDAEGQKLSGPALVGFIVSEVKVRTV
ncbi:MAG: hypothetical protein ACO3S0_17095 [bacterium]